MHPEEGVQASKSTNSVFQLLSALSHPPLSAARPLTRLSLAPPPRSTRPAMSHAPDATPLPELTQQSSSASSSDEKDVPVQHAGINFSNDEDTPPQHRPNGIGLPRVGTKELRLNRELTRDEKDLANAGYEKEIKDPKSEPKHVDIVRPLSRAHPG